MEESLVFEVQLLPILVWNQGPDIRYFTLKETIKSLKRETTLTLVGTKILALLEEKGQSMLGRDPDLLREMVTKSHFLLGSPLYLMIIQKMCEIYDTIQVKPVPSPLQCLVDQMEDTERLRVLCMQHEDLRWGQTELLSLIQTLLRVDDSPHPRTKCLRVIVLNSSCKAGTSGKIEWTEQFIDTVRLLLESGADPTWIPQMAFNGSVMFLFLQSAISIIAPKIHLMNNLMTLVPHFLTDQCLNHAEPRGTVLHSLVQCDWLKLLNCLPEDFFEQWKGIICKVVAAKPALCDMTDYYGRNPLTCFVSAIAERREMLKSLIPIVPVLKSESNVNAQDRDGKTMLHILAEKVVQLGPEAFFELYNFLGLVSYKDIQDKKGMTVLHILASKVPEIGLEAFLELYNCLGLISQRDIQNKYGETVLHILVESVSQMGCKVFLKLYDHLELSAHTDIQNQAGQTSLHMLANIVSEIGQEAFRELAQYLRSYSNMGIRDANGRSVLHVLAGRVGHEALLDLYKYLELDSCRDLEDKAGRTVLHILASRLNFDALLNVYNSLELASHRDIQDEKGQTVLHLIAERVSRCCSESFFELVSCLRTSSNVDIQDSEGRTTLHTLARIAFEEQETGLKLLAVFPLLTTEVNVNTTDNDSHTPFSWILIAKSRWGHDSAAGKAFSEIEELFLSKGARSDIAAAGFFEPIYIWIGKELSDKKCTYERLQRLLKCMNTLPDWDTQPAGKSLSYIKKFQREVWKNLWEIKNAKFISVVMDILHILMKDGSTAQHVWISLLKEQFEDSRNIITLIQMEMLCLCAERGALPTDRELHRILSQTRGITRKGERTVDRPEARNKETTVFRPVARNEKLTVAFLKTLIAIQKNKNFACDLQFLADFYEVTPKVIQLGGQLVHAVYGTMDNCLQSGKLVECFLFISHVQDNRQQRIVHLDESFIENSFYKNWLLRSPLHLGVVFLQSKNSLKHLPQNILQRYMLTTDIHGFTPLDLAYLHKRDQAVELMLSYCATENCFQKQTATDNNSQQDGSDSQIKRISQEVLCTRSGVLERMRPLLVLSQIQGETLINELITVFKRLVKATKFDMAQIKLTGSLREQLKTGQFDEADVQLRVRVKRLSDFEFSVAGVEWTKNDFLKEFSESLIESLGIISWDGIHVRPISVHGPWKFVRKGGNLTNSIIIDVDVVPLIVYEEEGKYVHKWQQEILEGAPLHNVMAFSTLEPWHDKNFNSTYFAFEWDMIDSLPASCRLAIGIAKVLLQVYDLSRGDCLRVKMPVTSYTIKSTLFYILAHSSHQLQFEEKNDHQKEAAETLKNALNIVEGNNAVCKLKFHPRPRWISDRDLDDHGEEARVLTCKIFCVIKYLAEQGWKMNDFWNRAKPAEEAGGFGEADYVLDICTCALERLLPSTFYNKQC